MDRWWTEAARLPSRDRGGRPRDARLGIEALEDRTVPAPLVITPISGGATPTQMVNNLLGAGVVASNIQFIGDPAAGGLFTGGSGVIGFEAGVILGTGSVTGAVGPNNSDGTTTAFGTPGDPDLDAIVSPDTTMDAAVLQFDFVPQSGSLRFDYVFSSEEYNEFVNSGFNDVFAFFLNGQNVALLPGTTTAVSIDTVNLTSNSSFYINNADPSGFDPSPATPPLLDTQMDGLTVVLTVQAQVNANTTNTIKLAIADVFDTSLDSNVFIRAGSFSSPPVPNFIEFRPYRYAFRDLEQNTGARPPAPLSGPATEESFDGNITLLNIGKGDAVGNLMVTLRNLPPGVVLLNRTGTEANTGAPFILVENVVVPANGTTPFRLPVKLSNPNLASLGTFWVEPYVVDVTIV